MNISYTLRAQVTPIDQNDWMDDECTISTFNGERMIYITRPQAQDIDPNSRVKEIEANVGGCCGCFTTKSKTKVIFEKSQYFLGETAKVQIICDNSECAKDISKFKFKLMRRHWARG